MTDEECSFTDENESYEENSQSQTGSENGESEVRNSEGWDESEIPDFDGLTSILVIGDTHFKPRAFEEGEELIERCFEVAEQISPTAIVLLGDILDTHETAKNAPWKQACRFIDGLSKLSKVYVIMGNHDLINQSQFLTDNHFFNPLKKWDNVIIVDKPIAAQIDDKTVVLCPYVPPGRFEEALDTLAVADGDTLADGDDDGGASPYDWREASCIFAHQEIAGVEFGGSVSTKGDEWQPEYPPLICGHIHVPCQIGNNVFYPGSSRQVDITENPDKKIWNVTFDENGGIEFDKIDLGLKGKREIEMGYEEINDFDFELVKEHHIKIKLRGTPEQFKMFRKSQLHAKMMLHNIKIGFCPIDQNTNPFLESMDRSSGPELSFSAILKELVKQKTPKVQKVYEDLYSQTHNEEDGAEGIKAEIIFG